MIAGLVGLGLGELAAGVLDRASPVVSVGNTVIDHVPAPIKRFAISSFGTNDKQVLIAGILTLTVLYAAFVGRVAVQRMRWGVLGVGAFGLLGTVAAVTGRTGEAGNAGPVVVASLGALAALASGNTWETITRIFFWSISLPIALSSAEFGCTLMGNPRMPCCSSSRASGWATSETRQPPFFTTP